MITLDVLREKGVFRELWGRPGSEGEMRDSLLTSAHLRFDLVAIDAGLKHMETTCRLQYFIKLQLVAPKGALYVAIGAIRDP